MKPSVAYLPWHERFPERFAKEREQMLARGFMLNEAALEQSKLVEFSGRSAVVPNLELRIRFPGTFPSKPPHVHAFGTGIRLRRHYRPDSGEICTFGPSRGRWSANLSGTTAIDEAEKVITDVSGGQSAGEKYLDDVPEPASTLYYYETPTFILVPPLVEAGALRPTIGTISWCGLRSPTVKGQSFAFLSHRLLLDRSLNSMLGWQAQVIRMVIGSLLFFRNRLGMRGPSGLGGCLSG